MGGRPLRYIAFARGVGRTNKGLRGVEMMRSYDMLRCIDRIAELAAYWSLDGNPIPGIIDSHAAWRRAFLAQETIWLGALQFGHEGQCARAARQLA